MFSGFHSVSSGGTLSTSLPQGDHERHRYGAVAGRAEKTTDGPSAGRPYQSRGLRSPLHSNLPGSVGLNLMNYLPMNPRTRSLLIVGIAIALPVSGALANGPRRSSFA